MGKLRQLPSLGSIDNETLGNAPGIQHIMPTDIMAESPVSVPPEMKREESADSGRTVKPKLVKPHVNDSNNRCHNCKDAIGKKQRRWKDSVKENAYYCCKCIIQCRECKSFGFSIGPEKMELYPDPENIKMAHHRVYCAECFNKTMKELRERNYKPRK